MKFISSTIVAALAAATTMGTASSVSAEADGTLRMGGKTRDTCDTDVKSILQKLAVTAELAERTFISIASFISDDLDNESGLGENDLAIFRSLLGDEFLAPLIEREEQGGDGEVSKSEMLAYLFNDIYADKCIKDLIEMRDELQQVPEELLVEAVRPASSSISS